MEYYSQFPEVILQYRASSPRVTEQSAEGLTPLDSHGLSEPR
jgi:hypothetical protein